MCQDSWLSGARIKWLSWALGLATLPLIGCDTLRECKPSKACWSQFPTSEAEARLQGASRLSCVFGGIYTHACCTSALMSLRKAEGHTRFIKPVYWAFDERFSWQSGEEAF